MKTNTKTRSLSNFADEDISTFCFVFLKRLRSVPVLAAYSEISKSLAWPVYFVVYLTVVAGLIRTVRTAHVTVGTCTAGGQLSLPVRRRDFLHQWRPYCQHLWLQRERGTPNNAPRHRRLWGLWRWGELNKQTNLKIKIKEKERNKNKNKGKQPCASIKFQKSVVVRSPFAGYIVLRDRSIFSNETRKQSSKRALKKRQARVLSDTEG